MALEGLKAGIFGAIGRLKGKRKLDEAEMKELSKSIRRALLEADFNVRQSKEITARLEERMIEEEPPGSIIWGRRFSSRGVVFNHPGGSFSFTPGVVFHPPGVIFKHPGGHFEAPRGSF